MAFFLTGIGTVAFDARIGLYQDPPSTEALEFIETVQNFFKYTQKLLYNPINVIVQPYMDTPTFKKFLKCGDSVLDAGQAFVAKRMTELKEMAEKGVDPSGDTQGIVQFNTVANPREPAPLNFFKNREKRQIRERAKNVFERGPLAYF